MPEPITIANIWHLSIYAREFGNDYDNDYAWLEDVLSAPEKYREEIEDAEAWIAAGQPRTWRHVWLKKCKICGERFFEHEFEDVCGETCCWKCQRDALDHSCVAAAHRAYWKEG